VGGVISAEVIEGNDMKRGREKIKMLKKREIKER
jgi:hypothetical protein